MAVGQPGAAAHEAAVQAVQAAFTELLLLQYCAQPYAAPEEEEEEAEEEAQSRGSGPPPLWAVEAMVQPVLRRFRYHFEGWRETNRRDKPEWVFSHCTGLLRLHRGLLSETVQPMLLAPLAALEAAFTSARLKEAERHRYVRMVALRCPHGVYVSLGGALCDAMAAKLTREMASLLRTPALFSHTLNECLGVEEELRYAHGIPAAAGSVLRAIYSAPVPLQRWLELERDDGAAALERLLQEAQWVAPRAALLQLAPGEGGGAPPPPPCAAGLLTLLGGVQRRMALVADPATQLALLQRVMLPLLSAFTERLRSRLNQQSLAAQMAAPAETDWPQLGGMLLATAHCASRLEEWSDSEPLAALLPREVPQAESAEPGASAGGAFGATLLEWAEIEREIEQLAHEIVTSSFGTAARKYARPPTCHLPPPTSHLPPPTSHLPPPTSHLPPPTSHLPPPTSHLPPPTSHLPPPTSHLPPPTSHLAPPTSHLPPRTSHLPLRTSHLAPPTSHLPPPTSHLPPPTSHLPPPTCHLPPPTSHLPPPTCHLPPPTSHLAPRTSHLPPPTSHLPPPTSHLPPATCHLPPPTSHLAPPTSHLLPHLATSSLLPPPSSLLLAI